MLGSRCKVFLMIYMPLFLSKLFYFHFLRNEPQKDNGISFPICVSTQSWVFWCRGSICSTPTSFCSVFGPSPNALGRSSHYEQCSDSKSSLPSGFFTFSFFFLPFFFVDQSYEKYLPFVKQFYYALYFLIGWWLHLQISGILHSCYYVLS